MNTSTTHAIPVFCKTSTPLTNNLFNCNKTNYGTKASQPSFDEKKMFNNINKPGMIMPM